MNKRRAVWALVMSAGVYGAFVLACGDESSSTFGENAPDAKIDSAPSFDIDAQDPSDSAVAASCNPALPSTFNPSWVAPTKGTCSAADVGEYYDICYTGADKAACEAWRGSHATCTQCIEPANNSGPIQIYLDRKFRAPNIAGCLALSRDGGAGDECAPAYSASVECQRVSCLGCFSTQGATLTDFQACQQNAKTTGCATYENAVGPKCGSGFTRPDGGSGACFRQSASELEKTHLTRLMGVFCGP
jgi:hypothetical protein